MRILIILLICLTSCKSPKSIKGVITVKNKKELKQGGFKYYIEPSYGRSFILYSETDYQINQKIKL